MYWERDRERDKYIKNGSFDTHIFGFYSLKKSRGGDDYPTAPALSPTASMYIVNCTLNSLHRGKIDLENEGKLSKFVIYTSADINEIWRDTDIQEERGDIYREKPNA